MKDDQEYEGPAPAEARKIAEEVRRRLGGEKLRGLYESIGGDSFEAQQHFPTDSLFGVAVRHVLFDMALDDPNIRNQPAGALLPLMSKKLKEYAVNEAYRNKFAGMAR